MISRQTALVLGEICQARFPYRNASNANQAKFYRNHADANAFYDFLYSLDLPSRVCNAAKRLRMLRDLKDFVMRLQTGEALAAKYRPREKSIIAKKRALAQSMQGGQKVLLKIAEGLLSTTPHVENLQGRLQLDGYAYCNGRLIPSEAAVLDVVEKVGLLHSLYRDLGLGNEQVALQCLERSEEYWLARKWDDCIHNSRKFLESVLQEIAASHHLRTTKARIDEKTYDKAELVRQYLHKNGILERKEENALREVYGLMSDTGSHPYMAQEDQARLLRQLSLVLCEFVLLRFKGSL